MEAITLSFGKRLKTARQAKKLTQVEVADKLGIDDTTISKYENDKSEPDNETLTKLLDLYEVNFDFIHGREIKDTSIEETDAHIKRKKAKELLDKIKDENLEHTLFMLEQLNKE